MKTSYVVHGAELSCSMSEKNVKLKVAKSRKVRLKGWRRANVKDCKPLTNIPSFGKCMFTDEDCKPACKKWLNGKSDVLVQGKPALLKTSITTCPVGAGVIKITDDGQAKPKPTPKLQESMPLLKHDLLGIPLIDGSPTIKAGGNAILMKEYKEHLEKYEKVLDKFTQGKKKNIKDALNFWVYEYESFGLNDLFSYNDMNWNRFDKTIVAFRNYWTYKLSPKTRIDSNYIKAMMRNESTMGTSPGKNAKKDVMQMFYPWDPDIHILARNATGYNNYIKDGNYWAPEGVNYGLPKKGFGAVKKLYNKNNFLVENRVTPELSICFGIRWLYYKIQSVGRGDVKKGIGEYNGGGDPQYLSKIIKTLKENGKSHLVKGW